MKKLLAKLFSKQIDYLASKQAQRLVEERFKEISWKKVRLNYPIGTKVIIRSNEPENLFIGKVVNYFDMEVSRKVLLVIEDETGKQIVPLDDAPPYWTKERENALAKLNWAEQWNVMSKYYDIDEEHQKYKESAEYMRRKEK